MPALQRARMARRAVRNGVYRHAVAAAQAQIAQRFNQLLCRLPFAEPHRRARIENQVHLLLLLLHEKLQEQPFKARVGVPVDAAHVVADGVFAEVRKLHAAPQRLRSAQPARSA